VAGGAMKSQLPHQLFEASRAFGLAFDLLQYCGIGESVQNRGLYPAQTIIRDNPLPLPDCVNSDSNRFQEQFPKRSQPRGPGKIVRRNFAARMYICGTYNARIEIPSTTKQKTVASYVNESAHLSRRK
jgi:hypothetical protein